MSLTEKEYADKLGVTCPNCDKTEGVEAWDTEIGMGCAWQNCSCTLCGATWDDQYTLDGYGNLETGGILMHETR